jgi:diguanylate cyclase (GGDEF)-like protein/PAS domain S-box-containing protein
MLLHSIRSRLLGLVLATVVPFTGLIGFGFWNQWRNDQATAIARATDEARLLAAQVDDHIGNLENLLAGLSAAVSTNAADAGANDALLRQARAELPEFIASILLFSPDGSNIGRSGDTALARSNATNRVYFQQVLAGQRLAVGDPIRGVPNGRWIATVARPIEDQQGKLRAVLAVGTFLDHFQDALRLQRLPAGSLVEIVDERGIGIARSADSLDWIGRDLSKVDPIARHIAAKEISEIVRWSDDVERITGSSTANKVPWLVVVGLPTDIAFAAVASRLTWSALFVAGTLMAAFAIAWTLSGRIVRPLRQLGKDASTLAAGDLGHRTAVRTHDEVGALADNFNRMAESLDRRQDEALGSAEELRKAKDTLATVIDASPVAIVCTDLDCRIFLWSRAAEEIFGYAAEEAAGQRGDLVPPKSGDETHQLFERAINGETLRNLRLKKRRKDGSVVHIRASAAPMYNPDGTVRGVARAYEDITNQIRAEAQLERVAHYDQLTGLPNRLSLQKELGRRLSGEGYSNPTSIMLFDLDSFKDVNDTLGHSTGDHLLVEVGERLVEAAGPTRAVCRLGGDEFVVIVPDCGNPLTVGPLADAMLKRLAEPFKINDHVLHVGGSAGIAIAPGDGANVDELIANADLALYQAKSEGGRTYRFFLPVLRAQAQARRSLDLELRRAFAENEFELYFQPQVRLADGAVVGAEALLRWHHPVRGILAPGVFIETLAVSAIAPEVSRWIIRTACEKTAAWRAEGLALSRIGVNLFPCQLSGETLLKVIGDALQDSNLPTEILELEITEKVALNFEGATVLQKLHEKGVKLAFDDFGTGYASLSYLTRFPLARIKIDRSFVGKITDDASAAAIVRSLIAMAHNLELEVIAEGVETNAQAEFLLNEHCEEAQGYLYAKALPAEQFGAFLRTSRLAVDTTKTPDMRLARAAKLHGRADMAPGRRRLPTG